MWSVGRGEYARSASRLNDPPVGPPDLARCSGRLQHDRLLVGGQSLFPKARQGGLYNPGLEQNPRCLPIAIEFGAHAEALDRGADASRVYDGNNYQERIKI